MDWRRVCQTALLNEAAEMLCKAEPVSARSPTFKRSSALAYFMSCVLATLPLVAPGQVTTETCGEFYTAYGPFDFRTIGRMELRTVEINHFTPNVENLVKGETGPLGGDLAYTLRAIPNHPRALNSMARLARVEKRPVPKGARYSVDCWYEHAIQFAPNDPAVRVVIGINLLKDGDRQGAIKQLRIAEELAPENATVQYNLGLAYFDLKDFDRSLSHAKRAYELGFPLPGLRDKLVRAGKWKD